jgi:Family of unknown function (DUF6636)
MSGGTIGIARGVRRQRRAALAALAICVGAGLGGAPHAGAQSVGGYFKTPSGNIICFYDTGAVKFVQCGIRSGLKPAVPSHRCPVGDPVHDRIDLPASGRPTVPRCAGDPGPFLGYQEHPRTLAYGRHWSGAGMRCTSAKRGLTCRNRDGHGFFLSRTRWHRF